MVKKPPSDAGDTSLILGLGGFRVPWGNRAHVPQMLKPEHLEPEFRSKRSRRNEKPTHHS